MVFIDNKYTHKYYQIIESARQTRNLEVKAEHHIIPRSFYKSEKSDGILPGNPNVPENLILLTPREHFICHWLLTKITTGILRKKANHAFWWMIQTSSEDIRITSRVYANAHKKIAKQHSERLTGKDAIIKGRKAYTNGIVTKMLNEHPGEGWVEGNHYDYTQRLIGTKGNKAYNNGIITKFFVEDPGGDWVLGSLQTNTHTKGRNFWNNGVKEIQSFEQPGPEWKKGRLPGLCGGNTTGGKRMWNDGITNKFSANSPGPGWILGRLSRK